MPSNVSHSPAGLRKKRGSGAKYGQSAVQASWADVPVSEESTKGLLSPRSGDLERKTTSEAMPHGPSILKEIFPDHGKIPQQVLDRIPSPSRRRGINAGLVQGSPVRSGPPAGGMGMHMSPQSPVRPIQRCEAPHLLSTPPPSQQPQQALQFQPVQQALQFQPAPQECRESAPMNYRERLRAGGRGALQRGFDAGFVPKPMHQQQNEWDATQAYGQGYADYDAQYMWNGQDQMASDDWWGASMNSQQYMQQGHMQEMPDYYQQQMAPQPQELLLPAMSPHQHETQTMMQMSPMTPQMGPMTPQGECQQVPPMQMQAPQTELVIPGAAQLSGDADLMALQLKAAAELQECYED